MSVLANLGDDERNDGPDIRYNIDVTVDRNSDGTLLGGGTCLFAYLVAILAFLY